DYVSGSCMARGKENIENDGIVRTAYVDRIGPILAGNPDVIVIIDGNDGYYQVPLGDTNSTDLTTENGAAKYIAASIANSGKPTQVIWIGTTQRNGNLFGTSSTGRNNYYTYKAYDELTTDICNKYSFRKVPLFYLTWPFE